MESENEAAEPLQDRLLRLAAQIHDLRTMVAERRTCDQILVEVLSARRALEAVASAVVTDTLGSSLTLPTEEARTLIKHNLALLAQL